MPTRRQRLEDKRLLYKRLIYILSVLLFFVGAGFGQSDTVYIPQVGHGQGFETTLTFMNGSVTTNRVAIRTYDGNGDPVNLLLQKKSPIGDPTDPDEMAVDSKGIELAGLGTVEVMSLNDNPSGLTLGYAEIEADWGENFSVEAVFRRFQGNILETTTSVLPFPATKAVSFFAFANSFARTGVAILNPAENEEAAEVEFMVYDNLGTLYDTATLDLAEGEKIAQFLDEAGLFPDLAGGDFTGSCEVRSNVPVALTVIKQEGSQGFFTTQTQQPARNVD
jgi:hypothetical protein